MMKGGQPGCMDKHMRMMDIEQRRERGNANSFWQVPLDQWGDFQGELHRKTLVFPQGGF